MGNLLRDSLHEIQNPVIKAVRGKGLMCAIEIDENYKSAKKICNDMMLNGLLAKPTQGNIIRLSPPLIINKNQIEEGLDIIKKSLN